MVAHKSISKIALCKQVMTKARSRRLGFEAHHVSYAFVSDLEEKLAGKKIVPVSNFIERFRMIKTASELVIMQQAIAMNEKAFGYLQRTVRTVASEVEIKNAVEMQMRKVGADDPSFPTIVASGMRSAFPHAHSTKSRIMKNALLLADMGTRYQHYCSDMTRTFYVGSISRFFQRIYDVVLRAQKIACAAIKPGVKVSAVVKSVQRHFKEHGVAQYFTHALGHGIGLEVHEAPVLHDKNNEVFCPGMVVTIEPGLYFPGRGGVRIEDMVLVNPKGAEVLSHYPTALNRMKVGN